MPANPAYVLRRVPGGSVAGYVNHKKENCAFRALAELCMSLALQPLQQYKK